MMNGWYSQDDVMQIVRKWKAHSDELARQLKKAQTDQQDDAFIWEELHKAREALESLQVELAAADETIKQLRARNGYLYRRNQKLERYAEVMERPSPRATVRIGKQEHVWITSPLSAEQIFQRIYADSCSLMTENEEQMARAIAAFDLPEPLPFTEDVGRGGVKLGYKMPRPGQWSLARLGLTS